MTIIPVPPPSSHLPAIFREELSEVGGRQQAHREERVDCGERESHETAELDDNEFHFRVVIVPAYDPPKYVDEFVLANHAASLLLS